MMNLTIKGQVDSALGIFNKAVTKLETIKGKIVNRQEGISIIQQSLIAERANLDTEEKRIDNAIGKINEILG